MDFRHSELIIADFGAPPSHHLMKKSEIWMEWMGQGKIFEIPRDVGEYSVYGSSE